MVKLLYIARGNLIVNEGITILLVNPTHSTVANR
jgi:hypothetical protein